MSKRAFRRAYPDRKQYNYFSATGTGYTRREAREDLAYKIGQKLSENKCANFAITKHRRSHRPFPRLRKILGNGSGRFRYTANFLAYPDERSLSASAARSTDYTGDSIMSLPQFLLFRALNPGTLCYRGGNYNKNIGYGSTYMDAQRDARNALRDEVISAGHNTNYVAVFRHRHLTNMLRYALSSEPNPHVLLRARGYRLARRQT